MSREEAARKMDMIAQLSAGEIEGWVAARSVEGRARFDGEAAALQARAKALKMTI